jgi:hypothetical protein
MTNATSPNDKRDGLEMTDDFLLLPNGRVVRRDGGEVVCPVSDPRWESDATLGLSEAEHDQVEELAGCWNHFAEHGTIGEAV